MKPSQQGSQTQPDSTGAYFRRRSGRRDLLRASARFIVAAPLTAVLAGIGHAASAAPGGAPSAGAIAQTRAVPPAALSMQIITFPGHLPRPRDGITLVQGSRIPVEAGYSGGIGRALMLTMRTDLAPWEDSRVRTALALCQNMERFARCCPGGEGELVTPETLPNLAHTAEPFLGYRPDVARTLLEDYASEAQLELPLEIPLAITRNSSGTEVAGVLRDLAEPAGLRTIPVATDPSDREGRQAEVNPGDQMQRQGGLEALIIPLT